MSDAETNSVESLKKTVRMEPQLLEETKIAFLKSTTLLMPSVMKAPASLRTNGNNTLVPSLRTLNKNSTRTRVRKKLKNLMLEKLNSLNGSWERSTI